MWHDNPFRLLLGGPGCGKTTSLLSLINEDLKRGALNGYGRVAFVSFTRAAALEAAARVKQSYTGETALTKEELPWFRTIHSLAYRAMGVTREEMMGPRDLNEFARVVDERLPYDILRPPYGGGIAGRGDDSDEAGDEEETTEWIYGSGKEEQRGSLMLQWVEYASNTMLPLESVWHLFSPGAPSTITWHDLRRFAEAYDAYKQDSGKIDFSDLLHLYRTEGGPLDVDLAIVDEAQDLTPLQWEVIGRAFAQGNPRMIIAGDDDQAIYAWAGADVGRFLSLQSAPRAETLTLGTTWRLPPAVHNYAQQITTLIGGRYAKPFTPDPHNAQKEPGLMQVYQDAESLAMSLGFYGGTWLLLARNQYLLARWEILLQDIGLNYTRAHGLFPAVRLAEAEIIEKWITCQHTSGGLDFYIWEPREIRRLMRLMGRTVPLLRANSKYALAQFGITGEELERGWEELLTEIPERRRAYYARVRSISGARLTDPPRVRVETIHAVKGAEADHVALLSDVSPRTYRAYETEPDFEHRTFYVAVTRARRTLHLVAPAYGATFYPLPGLS